jgi:AAA domain-containing protein
MIKTGIKKASCQHTGTQEKNHGLPSGDKIINLKERSFMMLKKDLALRNPLRLIGKENQDILSKGGFGAVLARAGVGKTALMVQLSLETLLRGKNVLHVSLSDPVNKVNLWYQEVFQNLAKQYNAQQVNQLWESILHNRFIMTFKVEGFSVPKLAERMTDLTEQNIFTPHMIVIDGFPFDDEVAPLKQLKSFSKEHKLCIWFSVRTHRHEEPQFGGIPPQLADIDELFEVMIQLQPEGKNIHVKAIRGEDADTSASGLILDPSTMLMVSKTDTHSDQ